MYYDIRDKNLTCIACGFVDWGHKPLNWTKEANNRYKYKAGAK